MTDSLPRSLTAFSRVMRRPLAMWIGCLGIAVGFPVGRLLHDSPQQRKLKSAAVRKSEEPPREREQQKQQPSQNPPAPVVVPGMSPEEAEAVRVAEALLDEVKEWQKREVNNSYLIPLSLLQKAAALGERAEVELVIARLAVRKPFALADIVLAAWADRDPAAAWDFYTRGVKERKRLPFGSTQFVRRMAKYHWALVEPHLTNFPDYASYTVQEIWAQRVGDVAHDAEELRSVIFEQAPEKTRGACVSRALWVLAAEHPQKSMALLQELPEKERRGWIGNLAELLVKNQPSLALDVVRKHRGDMYSVDRFTGVDEHDSAERVLSALVRREGMAPALNELADLYNKNQEADTRSVAANLARRTAEWMPAAVTAARGQVTGPEFLSELVQRCPWQSSAEVCGEIAAITEPALQGAAAESWAWRWSAEEPEAARQWVESLPEAAKARALCGLWKSGTPPGTALAACAQAGVVPSENVLEEMILTAPEFTNYWLSEQPGTASRQLARAARVWSTKDPGAAAEWAVRFSDSAERVQAVTAVMQVWLQISPGPGVAWLNAAPLDDADRAAVQTFTGLGPTPTP